MPELKAPSVTVTKHEVALDPAVCVFNVVLQTEGGTWNETWPTEAELRSFLRGVRAACEMLGVIFHEPEIPEETTSILSENHPVPDDSSIPF